MVNRTVSKLGIVVNTMVGEYKALDTKVKAIERSVAAVEERVVGVEASVTNVDQRVTASVQHLDACIVQTRGYWLVGCKTA